MLTDDEQRLLGALALFPGGVTLDTAEVVGRQIGTTTNPVSVLARLVDTSLMEPILDVTPVRYRMLETIRTFALDTLDASGLRTVAEQVQDSWARDLVTAVAVRFGSPEEPLGVEMARSELPNIRAVHDRAAEHGDRPLRIELLTALAEYTPGHLAEVLEWGWLLAEEFGDDADAVVSALAAQRALARGHTELAESMARRNFALFEPHDRLIVLTFDALATALMYQGRFEESVEVSLAAARTAGISPFWPASFHSMAGLASVYAGDVDTARCVHRNRARPRRALRVAQRQGDRALHQGGVERGHRSEGRARRLRGRGGLGEGAPVDLPRGPLQGRDRLAAARSRTDGRGTRAVPLPHTAVAAAGCMDPAVDHTAEPRGRTPRCGRLRHPCPARGRGRVRVPMLPAWPPRRRPS